MEFKVVIHPPVWYMPFGVLMSSARYNLKKDNLLGIGFLFMTLVVEW